MSIAKINKAHAFIFSVSTCSMLSEYKRKLKILVRKNYINLENCKEICCERDAHNMTPTAIKYPGFKF